MCHLFHNRFPSKFSSAGFCLIHFKASLVAHTVKASAYNAGDPGSIPGSGSFQVSSPCSHGSLKCRRCVVVGNGHRLRNSSLGEAINKYDVVIRSVWPPFPLLSGNRPAELRVTGILLPTSQVKQCPCGWLRAGRGLQDHHASLLP